MCAVLLQMNTLGNQKDEVKANLFARRILLCRHRMGLSQNELSDKIGVSLRTVQLWEAGTSLPQPKKMRKLSDVTGQPIPWLLGEGPLEATTTPPSAPLALMDNPVALPPNDGLPSVAIIESLLSSAPNATRPQPATQFFPRRAPVVSWAKAGDGGNFGDLCAQINESVDTDCADTNAYALIIEGDSMMPEFKPGDRVVFMPNTSPQNGDVVVARLERTGDVFFKIFHQAGTIGEFVRLTSYNPAYPPLEYPLMEFRFIHPMHSMVRRRRR
jgi:SOS-response transcriptional repressor LexA